MINRTEILRGRCKTLLKQNGLSWKSMTESAEQIIVFGSAAIGINRKESDLDILCVGDGKRFKNQQLDIVWRTPDQINRDNWLGSELAVHIGKYGVWVWGKDNWSKRTWVSEDALDYKLQLIRGRATALENSWKTLGKTYRQKHVVKLRRDMQRYEFLMKGDAVPPTPLIDRLWSKPKNAKRAILAMIQRLPQLKLVRPSQVHLFSELWHTSL